MVQRLSPAAIVEAVVNKKSNVIWREASDILLASLQFLN
jgi:hypothetical protein